MNQPSTGITIVDAEAARMEFGVALPPDIDRIKAAVLTAYVNPTEREALHAELVARAAKLALAAAIEFGEKGETAFAIFAENTVRKARGFARGSNAPTAEARGDMTAAVATAVGATDLAFSSGTWTKNLGASENAPLNSNLPVRHMPGSRETITSLTWSRDPKVRTAMLVFDKLGDRSYRLAEVLVGDQDGLSGAMGDALHKATEDMDPEHEASQKMKATVLEFLSETMSGGKKQRNATAPEELPLFFSFSDINDTVPPLSMSEGTKSATSRAMHEATIWSLYDRTEMPSPEVISEKIGEAIEAAIKQALKITGHDNVKVVNLGTKLAAAGVKDEGAFLREALFGKSKKAPHGGEGN